MSRVLFYCENTTINFIHVKRYENISSNWFFGSNYENSKSEVLEIKKKVLYKNVGKLFGVKSFSE